MDRLNPEQTGEAKDLHGELEAAPHREDVTSAMALTAIEAAAARIENREKEESPQMKPLPGRPRKRHVDEETGLKPEPVLRALAERRNERAPSDVRVWCDAHDIAEMIGIPLHFVEKFIELHRHKLGNMFIASQQRRPSRGGNKLTEHFSPQFTAWAAESLSVSLARHRERLATEQLQYPPQDAS
jgi:hypothetical protein